MNVKRVTGKQNLLFEIADVEGSLLQWSKIAR
jgi:hypothetical protein